MEESHSTNENACQIEILPFQMNYNGPAPVKMYFLAEPSSNNPTAWNAHFRGRKLIGKVVELPDSVTLYHAAVGDKQSNLEGTLQIHHEYPKLRVWQHDHPPETTSFQECLNWCEIANIIHGDDE